MVDFWLCFREKGDFMRFDYKLAEIREEIEILKNTFDIVRLVEPIQRLVCDIHEDTIGYNEFNCHNAWEKEKRCQNCISVKALQDKQDYTKFEFVQNEIYFVIARFVKVDERELVLEMVIKVSQNILLRGDGYNEFVDRIIAFNESLYTDALTGIYNRRYVNEQLPFLIRQAFLGGGNLAVSMVDIDHFKSINDEHGHQFGDKVLCKVAHFLQNNISKKKGDFVVRYGGDEFLLVFLDIEETAYRKRLLEIMELSRDLKLSRRGNDVNISLSMGGAHLKELEDPAFDSVISLSDKRMYDAKRSGRGQLVLE